MLSGNWSPEICFLMEEGKTITFKRFLRVGEEKPSIEECKGKLTGISLSYAFCGEQDFGIRPLAKAFGVVDDNMVIRKIPLSEVKLDGVRAIKYGPDTNLDQSIVFKAKQYGVIGYWDSENLMICVAPEYGFLIDAIKDMMKPRQVRFAFHSIFGGRYHLVILN